jgi:hypothetical protein
MGGRTLRDGKEETVIQAVAQVRNTDRIGDSGVAAGHKLVDEIHCRFCDSAKVLGI